MLQVHCSSREEDGLAWSPPLCISPRERLPSDEDIAARLAMKDEDGDKNPEQVTWTTCFLRLLCYS